MYIPQSAIEWVSSQDTGTSSKTMFKALSGQVYPGSYMSPYEDIPHDADDFGRCYRLVLAVPEWKDRLNEVATAFPGWGPIIREWDRLVELFLKEDYRGVYRLISSLVDEVRVLDGWEKTGPGSWTRNATEPKSDR